MPLIPGKAQSVSADERVKPGNRNCNSSSLTKSDQVRQAFNPELDIAGQLGRESFRPRLALAQIFPLRRGLVRQPVSPHDPPPCPAKAPSTTAGVFTVSLELQSDRITNFRQDSQSAVFRQHAKVRGMIVKGMGKSIFRMLPEIPATRAAEAGTSLL